MSAPVIFRYAAFTLFSICCLVILALAGTNLSQTKVLGQSTPISRVDKLLVCNGVMGLLAVFIVLPLERLRPFPVTSKLFVEVAWIAVLCVFNISAAVAVTVIGVQDICSPKWTSILPRSACGSVGGLQAFSWLATVTLLFYAIFISSCARLNAARVPNIWCMTVLEVEWKAKPKDGPVLPTYHEKHVPVYTVGVKPLLTAQKTTVTLAVSTEKAINRPSPPVPHKRASDLISTPASYTATPPLYPQFYSSTQTRAASQQPASAMDQASVHSPSETPAPESGRSTPSSVTLSSASSPLSSPSSAGSKPEASDASSGRRSGSASPRTKRRPPPLNLTGLSAFDAAAKSKQRQVRK